MLSNARFETVFGECPLMAIMRGLGTERSLAVATAAWDLGIDVVEVTIQTAQDVESLRAVVDAGRERGKSVGAGTVVSVEQVRQAADAGAGFTVSPGYDLEVVRASTEAGLVSLPGVSSATEVQAVMREGLTWMKVFPATVLGPGWVSAMRAPFPEATFVTTGGINAANAADFLRAGARVVAVGSALEDPAQLPRLAALMAADS